MSVRGRRHAKRGEHARVPESGNGALAMPRCFDPAPSSGCRAEVSPGAALTPCGQLRHHFPAAAGAAWAGKTSNLKLGKIWAGGGANDWKTRVALQAKTTGGVDCGAWKNGKVQVPHGAPQRLWSVNPRRSKADFVDECDGGVEYVHCRRRRR